jgi:hypothetical protein
MPYSVGCGVTCEAGWDRFAGIWVPISESQEEWPQDETLDSHLQRQVLERFLRSLLGDASSTSTKNCQHDTIDNVASVGLRRPFEAWLSERTKRAPNCALFLLTYTCPGPSGGTCRSGLVHGT